jgi:hypothetical protein
MHRISLLQIDSNTKSAAVQAPCGLLYLKLLSNPYCSPGKRQVVCSFKYDAY